MPEQQVDPVVEQVAAPSQESKDLAELDAIMSDDVGPPIVGDGIFTSPEATPDATTDTAAKTRARNEKWQYLPETHEHSPVLVEMAKEFGMTDEEITKTPPATLDRQIAQFRRFERSRPQPSSSPRDAAPPVPPPEEPVVLPFDEDYVAPEIAAWMKDQIKEKRALKQGMDEIKGMLGQQAVQSKYEQAQAVFSAYPQVFGQGPADEGTAEYKRQKAVWTAAHEDTSSIPFRNKVAKAAMELGMVQKGAKAARPAADPYTEERDAKRWNEAALSKPTHRTGATEAKPFGTAKAVESVKAKMDEFAAEVTGRTDEDILESFPE